MRRLAALVVLPLALGAPARRHAAQQDDTDVLKPSYATCHEPKMKEVCPGYNTIMYMCCEQSDQRQDHVETCKRMLLQHDVCGGTVTMQATMEQCCSFEWSCEGNGWCGSSNPDIGQGQLGGGQHEALSELKKLGQDSPVVVVTDGTDDGAQQAQARANCVSLVKSTTDDWCSITCATSDCPKTVCKCKDDGENAVAASPAPTTAAQSGVPVPKLKVEKRPKCVALTPRVTDQWCMAACNAPVAAQTDKRSLTKAVSKQRVESDTCAPSLCKCDGEMSSETPDNGMSTFKKADDSARAGWEAVATEKAAAGAAELKKHDDLEKSAVGWATGKMDGAREEAERVAEEAARNAKQDADQKKAIEVEKEQARKIEAGYAAAAKAGKGCVSLVPSLLSEWCSNTCTRGTCPISVCKCGDPEELEAELAKGEVYRVKGEVEVSKRPACVSIVSEATDEWCSATCADTNTKHSVCPKSKCKCENGGGSAPTASPLLDSPCVSLIPNRVTDDWCSATCADDGQIVCPAELCKCADGREEKESSSFSGSLSKEDREKLQHDQPQAPTSCLRCGPIVDERRKKDGPTSCISLEPNHVTNDWCSATCADVICPTNLCKCGPHKSLIGASPQPSPSARSARTKEKAKSSKCWSVADDSTDDWCAATCLLGPCPDYKCKCDGDTSERAIEFSCKAIAPDANDGWCTATCLSGAADGVICPADKCKCNDITVPKPQGPGAKSPRREPKAEHRRRDKAKADEDSNKSLHGLEAAAAKARRDGTGRSDRTARAEVARVKNPNLKSPQGKKDWGATEDPLESWEEAWGPDEARAEASAVANAEGTAPAQAELQPKPEQQAATDVWTYHEGGLNCFDGMGATGSSPDAIPGTPNVQQCKEACIKDSKCRGIVVQFFDKAPDFDPSLGRGRVSCWLREEINVDKCERGTGYEVYTVSRAWPHTWSAPAGEFEANKADYEANAAAEAEANAAAAKAYDDEAVKKYEEAEPKQQQQASAEIRKVRAHDTGGAEKKCVDAAGNPAWCQNAGAMPASAESSPSNTSAPSTVASSTSASSPTAAHDPATREPAQATMGNVTCLGFACDERPPCLHMVGVASDETDCKGACNDDSQQPWCVAYEFIRDEKGTCKLYDNCTICAPGASRGKSCGGPSKAGVASSPEPERKPESSPEPEPKPQSEPTPSDSFGNADDEDKYSMGGDDLQHTREDEDIITQMGKSPEEISDQARIQSSNRSNARGYESGFELGYEEGLRAAQASGNRQTGSLNEALNVGFRKEGTAASRLTCSKCGQNGHARPNCCSPGGAWEGMCDDGGQYTYHEGYTACNTAVPVQPVGPATTGSKQAVATAGCFGTACKKARANAATAVALPASSSDAGFCHDLQRIPQFCPQYAGIMSLCCEQAPKRPTASPKDMCGAWQDDKRACGGAKFMRTAMQRCCAYEWSCDGGWCGPNRNGTQPAHAHAMGWPASDGAGRQRDRSSI